MILKHTIIFLFLAFSLFSQGQLVRKKDYDAALAAQAGINTGIALPGSPQGLKIDGIYGLKMTFPFDRKWFLGAEINYNPLHLQAKRTISGFLPDSKQQPLGPYVHFSSKTKIHLQTLNIPLYVKYMLRSNRTSVLLGGYFSWHWKSDLTATSLKSFTFSAPSAKSYPMYLILESDTDKWDAGITAGLEQKLLKHLNLMLKISGSVKNLVSQEEHFSKNIFPLQAHLTLSYDILRIGDCGCD